MELQDPLAMFRVVSCFGVLCFEDRAPETWRRIRIRVIYIKGKEEDVGNYCPICTLPALYKLFSAIIYNRNQKTREGLDVLSKRWTIFQHTDCVNRNAMSGASKCGSRQWTS